jgi:DNA-binding protein YbaB
MNEIKLATDYKGFHIEYSDWNKITISQEGTEIKRDIPTIEACQEWIDKKLKQKYKRVAVLCKRPYGYRDGLPEKGEATSVVNNDHVWVTTKAKGERQKVNIDSVYLDTPENNKLIAEVKALSEERKQIDTEIETKMSELTHLEVAMMELPE